MRRVLVRLVDLYRRFLSPLLPPRCRFEPSCSAYAREVLLLHGAFRGTLLSVWRVLRCNPFCRGGYDPVPEAGKGKGTGGGASTEKGQGEDRGSAERS
jgi:hypothetical protein